MEQLSPGLLCDETMEQLSPLRAVVHDKTPRSPMYPGTRSSSLASVDVPKVHEDVTDVVLPITTIDDSTLPVEKTAEEGCVAQATDCPAAALPAWWHLVLHPDIKREPTHWLDGLVGCATDDAKYLITSPTASYIPRPIYGKIEICMHDDGHFGSADPIHHPQFIQHESHYPWMAAIQRNCSARSLLRDIWHPLDRTVNFELVKTSNVGLGVVPSAFKRYANEAILPLGELVATFEQLYGTNPELNWLFSTLLDAVDRLAFPATFRDMARTWACVQRFSLYTCAWFDWNIKFMQTYRMPSLVSVFDPIPYDQWMGCLTTSTLLASRLAKANVPVWLMRPMENFSGDEVVEKAVVFTEPKTCMQFSRSEQCTENRALFAYGIKSIRIAGDEHLTWINRMAIRNLDDSMFPSNALSLLDKSEPVAATTETAVVHATPSTPHEGLNTSNRRYTPYSKPYSSDGGNIKIGKNERMKFEEFSHPLLPPSIPQWQSACSSVDISSEAPSGSSVWKYMFPEARLVVTSPTPRRQLRFIRNWLRLRETWLFLASSMSYNCHTVHPLRNQEWREYLYTSSATQTTNDSLTSNIALKNHKKRTKKSVEHKLAVHNMFRDLFGQNVMDCPIPDTWFERTLSPFHGETSELTGADTVRTVQLLGWELNELEFRWELMQLEDTLVPIDVERLVEQHERQQLVDAIFPAKCKLRITELPSANQGLSAENVETRAPYLEAFRQLLSRWPSVPSSLADCEPLTSISTSLFEQKEVELIHFYCQTFWTHAGRAPVLPRRLPVSTN
ncbi:hypothetical protein EIP86_001108 [Pleurotus ostreatoroseus]|nr:hypothetical protein EIP86_001108 [Pleurotus ostreatoroseus]